MGSVYRAFDRELEEEVALKVIRRDLLQQPEMLARLRKEVKLARRITHRNVARVFDLGEAAGERYFTMELVRGRSLGAILDRGALEVREVARIGRELSLALEAAHAVGVIHRDLKPDNVLIADDGRVVVTDFGIARSLELPATQLTLSGQLLGTPDYLAPELVAAQGPADERSDVFALGVILFEALTRRMPWRGEGLAAVSARLGVDAPDVRTLRPEVPEALAELVRACLARAPMDRPASAGVLAEALARIVDAADDDPASRATLPVIEPAAFSPERVPPALAEGARVRTVAILPFEEPGAAAATYLSEGVSDLLAEALGGAAGLAVRPRALVGARREGALGVSSLGEKLGVEALVLGSVARSGADLDLTIRLLDTQEGHQLWAEHRTLRLEDVFAVTDELAAAIAARLSAQAARGPAPVPAAPGFAELMLEARHAYHSFWQDDTLRAVDLYERALALCPTAPRALAGLALATLRTGFFTGGGLDQVRAVIERTRAVEPDLPELHLAQASVLVQENQPLAAVAPLRRALELAPDLAEAGWLLGRLLLEANAVELAAKRLTWALVMEPGLSVARRDLARASALLGRWDECERVSTAEPGGQIVGPWLDRSRFALWRRNGGAARELLAVFPEDDAMDVSVREQLGIARALLAAAAEGSSPLEDPSMRAFLVRARGTPRRGAFAAQIEAEVQAFLGDDEATLLAVEAALRAGLTDLAWLERCPLFAPLRDHPAFVRARIQVGRVAAPVRDAILGG